MMTAQATCAVAPSHPGRATAAVTHLPRQYRRSVHARRGQLTAAADPARDNAVVTDLVTRARQGDTQAWDALVERYAPLIWSICRRHHLANGDADDVGQSVWLHLVDQLDKVRNPATLPGWLATTTRRECLRVLRTARGPLAAGYELDADGLPDEQAGTVELELLAAELRAALREAFQALPPEGQQLIALLLEDPPLSYAQISARLGIPVGSIGPTRGRYLDKVRRHPAVAALIDAQAACSAVKVGA